MLYVVRSERAVLLSGPGLGRRGAQSGLPGRPGALRGASARVRRLRHNQRHCSPPLGTAPAREGLEVATAAPGRGSRAGVWLNSGGALLKSTGQALAIWCRHTSASLLVQGKVSSDVQAELEAFFACLVPDGAAGCCRRAEEGPDDSPPTFGQPSRKPNCLSPSPMARRCWGRGKAFTSTSTAWRPTGANSCCTWSANGRRGWGFGERQTRPLVGRWLR